MPNTAHENGRHETARARVGGARGHAVLLVGASEPLRALESQVARSLPAGGRVEVCPDWFEAIARLAQRSFDVVVVQTELAEHRPETAVRTLREAAGDARIVLVTPPTHEGLSRRMLAVGADEYLVLPVTAEDVLAARMGDIARPASASMLRTESGHGSAARSEVRVEAASTPFTLAGLAVAEIVLDAMVREPADAAGASIRELNARLPAGARLELQRATERDPTVPPGMTLFSRVIRLSGAQGELETPGDRDTWVLHLFVSLSLEESSAEELLSQVATQMKRVLELQDRHCRLQKLAITDDLTGLYNTRYFRHFLERILQRAKEGRFPVTLLLFDIDCFKKYNDSFGHAVGDEILKQTARMIKRCVRDHDLVARLGGDEFAVVFWEKDGPRQVITPGQGTVKVMGGRPPQSPVSVFERFKRMIAGHDFEALGPTGRGQLTISGGLAVYPYDARTPDELIEAADKALMFGAKKSGKNTIHLVGQEGVEA